MQDIGLLNIIKVWDENFLMGAAASIFASAVFFILGKLAIFFIRIYEHVGWENRKGLDYIIVHPIKNETLKDMRISAIIFFINMFMAYVPFLLLFIVAAVAEFLVKLGAIGVFYGVLSVFGLALYTLHMQKRYENNKKIYKFMEITLIAIIILFSFSISVMVLGVCGNKNLTYYATVISLFLFFVIDFIYESKSSEQYYIKWIDKIKWIRYLGMFIGYILSFSESSNVGLSILFYTWIGICMFEYICANLFGKKSLAPYTVTCKEGTYITHDNILQMKDGKVNFKIDDRDVCIIDKEEIESIIYEMENPIRNREDNKNKIVYISKDKKTCICDIYAYMGKDWIEFRKKTARNIEITIMPSKHISSIRSCNKEDYHSIIDEKGSQF